MNLGILLKEAPEPGDLLAGNHQVLGICLGETTRIWDLLGGKKQNLGICLGANTSWMVGEGQV